MATSTCIKCGSSRFEAITTLPKNSPIRMIFVQCESCGGVAGVLDAVHVGRFVRGISESISTLAPFTLPNPDQSEESRFLRSGDRLLARCAGVVHARQPAGCEVCQPASDET